MPTIRNFVIDSLKSVVDELKLKSVTWEELVALRGCGNLFPGQQYRITDYVATTSQENTQSAGHQFDIIVTADATNKLNENARAIHHDGDTYFGPSTLSSWELKYCLDNDTTRFAWADSTNGKGVIYWMKDEYNNECPYDFKNIQFKRYKITACPKSPGLVGLYSINGLSDITVDTGDAYWCYTFSMINLFEDCIDDVSVYQTKYPSNGGAPYLTHDNVFKEYIGPDYDNGVQLMKLPNNAFVTDTDVCGIGEDYSYGNFVGFYSNTFGNGCRNNTFGNGCYCNTFGNSCQSNTFGYYFSSNTFGNNLSSNAFGNGCYRNTFGSNCYSNAFGNSCQSNTFGNSCFNNTFGDYCRYNTFGNECYHNTFGNDVQSCRLGDAVQHFIIGNQSGTTSSTKNYVQNIIVENGVQFVNAFITGTTTSLLYCQNVKIGLGISGTDANNRKQIDITGQIGATSSVTYQPANSQIISV